MVIIRSVGERTEQQLIDRYPGAVVIRHVTPFYEALKQCLEIGLESNAEQIVCIDADVTPAPKMYEELVSALQSHGDAYAAVPKLEDYLQGRRRTVGVHAYNRKRIPEALSYIGRLKGDARPESSLRKMMKRTIKLSRPLGVHGEGQYYRDIYRTALLWSYKHERHEAYLTAYWEERIDDPDFRVALRGWYDGKEMRVRKCDAGMDIDYGAILADMGLQEKEPL